MPTTTAGTTLSVLSVEGENHEQGWVFTIDPLSPDAILFEISDSGAGSEVIVKTAGPYVSPGDKYITVIATKGAVTYQSGVVIPVGDKGVELSNNSESVNFPVNMIAGQLSDTFAYRFAFRNEDAIGATKNLFGVEGDEYGLVELTEASTLKFYQDPSGAVLLYESNALIPNKWYDITVTSLAGGDVTITVNKDTSGPVALVGTPTFGSDLTTPWRVRGISKDNFIIWSDALETTNVGTLTVDGGALGDLGGDVDHFTLASSALVDTYTILGDATETIVLGTLEVAVGVVPDHISLDSTVDYSMQVSNVGAGHNGVELIREDLSGNTGGMHLGGTASLMAFLKHDS
jgi:hypothetical protein